MQCCLGVARPAGAAGAGIDCRFHVANDFLTEFLARRLATWLMALYFAEPAKPAERMGMNQVT